MTSLLPPAWYQSSIADFLCAPVEAIIGALACNGQFDLDLNQRNAWLEEIRILKSAVHGLDGVILLEFTIPRIGSRIDAVAILGPFIFVVEFKVGEETFERSAINQVWDYALDLKNFHKGSHEARIVPLLVSTAANDRGAQPREPDADSVYRPITLTEESLRPFIDSILAQHSSHTPISGSSWIASPYLPTPTIIEAARALYANHSVDAIARFDAGAQNLHVTSSRIEELIEYARENSRKLICFVTGVPGAGKTLVGLNVATRRSQASFADPAAPSVFLSGNGPLVVVLTEALTRDQYARERVTDKTVRKGRVAKSVKAFIQNVHHFRDAALRNPEPPPDHVAVFDEAQRAWNAEQTSNFMIRKKGISNFTESEPEFLISYMNRHEDWAVIVCLVGGGQEINTGEAGIETWIAAINSRFPNWEMHISDKLSDSEYAAGRVLDSIRHRPNTRMDEAMHLAVSMRSFRAENVSLFVKALLDCDIAAARRAHSEFADRYPIFVTRDLMKAKEWVRSRARGSERFGMLASSKAQRLKPHAIDVRVPLNPIHWFLNSRDDTRSSYYLEDAANEYLVQGLELDWTCVTWDGDLRHRADNWTYHFFRGDRWCNIGKPEIRQYLLNAYRVLLTRARQGMVIFVPHGDAKDPTRAPEFYDATFDYFESVGIPEVT